MPTWLAIVVMAALFALYAALRPRHCDGHCPGCGTGCGHFNGEQDHGH